MKLRKAKWEVELERLDKEREAESKAALAISILKSQAKVQASALEQAVESLRAGSSEYQAGMVVEVAAAESSRRRKAQKVAHKGQNSCFGHRAGSEGFDFDVALKKFLDAKGRWPSGEELQEFAGLWDFSLKRLKGHLNHVRAAHSELLPEQFRK